MRNDTKSHITQAKKEKNLCKHREMQVVVPYTVYTIQRRAS